MAIVHQFSESYIKVTGCGDEKSCQNTESGFIDHQLYFTLFNKTELW